MSVETRGISLNWDIGFTDVAGWINDAFGIGQRIFNYCKYGFSVYKKGAYAIVKGARSITAINQGIKGTRYAFANASKYGNVFARFIAGLMQVKDCTSGFRAIRADFIKQIDLEHLNVNGYAFQMNILFECVKLGAKTYEIPDRIKGQSKLSIKDVIEFILNSFDLFIRRFK